MTIEWILTAGGQCSFRCRCCWCRCCSRGHASHDGAVSHQPLGDENDDAVAEGVSHSSVDQSALTIRQPWVQIHLRLFQCLDQILLFIVLLLLECGRNENKQKEARIDPYMAHIFFVVSFLCKIHYN